MSIAALAWAADRYTGDPLSKLTLLALANWCGSDGIARPSEASMGHFTDTDVDAVTRALERRTAMCLIEPIGSNPFQPHGAAGWRLIFDLSAGELAAPDRTTPAATGAHLA